jgi:branched-chain amino acid transport system substrate-binding protein
VTAADRFPSTFSRRAALSAALGSLVATVAGCSRPVDAGTGGTDPSRTLNIGLLGTQTGDDLIVQESARFEAGLRTGLLWATTRTNKIGVRRFNVAKADDRDDPDAAEAAAEDLIRRGCPILAGGCSSPVALRLAEVAARRKVLYVAGTATADELSGINKYTFRSSSQTAQLLSAVKTSIEPGKRIAVLAAEGRAATTAAKALGAVVTIVGSGDFSDLAGRLKAARADQLYVDWPGPAPVLWRAIPDGVETVTLLGARATWDAYGKLAGSLKFVTTYVDGASDNNGYLALRAAVPAKMTDTGHVEGFSAGQMIARAFQSGPQSPGKMIKGLEGYAFSTVKGELAIRADDHCLLQPEWGVKLNAAGTGATITETFPAAAVAPPAR